MPTVVWLGGGCYAISIGNRDRQLSPKTFLKDFTYDALAIYSEETYANGSITSSLVELRGVAA